MEFSKKLGTCVDRLYSLRDKIKKKKIEIEKLGAVKDLAALESELKALEKHIIELVGNEPDMKGVLGRTAKCVINETYVPTVKDWGALYAHVKKTKNFSFLQKRLSSTAFREHWESGENIPGVQKMIIKKLSLTKL